MNTDGPLCLRIYSYNLECGYTDPAPRQSIKRKAEDQPDTLPPPPPPPAASLPSSRPPATTSATVGGDVANTILARLEELTHRTAGIEQYLRVLPETINHRPQTLPSLDALNLPDNIPGLHAEQASNVRTGNPMSTITESFQGFHGQDSNGRQMSHPYEGSAQSQSGLAGLQNGAQQRASTDAVSRGLITIEQAQRYFNLYGSCTRNCPHFRADATSI